MSGSAASASYNPSVSAGEGSEGVRGGCEGVRGRVTVITACCVEL